jgi:hypothetical protein
MASLVLIYKSRDTHEKKRKKQNQQTNNTLADTNRRKKQKEPEGLPAILNYELLLTTKANAPGCGASSSSSQTTTSKSV